MPTSGPMALLGMTYTEKPVEGRMGVAQRPHGGHSERTKAARGAQRTHKGRTGRTGNAWGTQRTHKGRTKGAREPHGGCTGDALEVGGSSGK